MEEKVKFKIPAVKRNARQIIIRRERKAGDDARHQRIALIIAVRRAAEASRVPPTENRRLPRQRHWRRGARCRPNRLSPCPRSCANSGIVAWNAVPTKNDTQPASTTMVMIGRLPDTSRTTRERVAPTDAASRRRGAFAAMAGIGHRQQPQGQRQIDKSIHHQPHRRGLKEASARRPPPGRKERLVVDSWS